MKILVIVSAIVLMAATFPRPVAAQELSGAPRWADSARIAIQKAVSEQDLSGLQAAEVLLSRALTAYPKSPLLLHYKGYALYREASMLRDDASHEKHRLFEEANSLLERSGNLRALPETYALRSTILGRLIATSSNPLAGLWYGPKSSAAMDRALEVGPRNPRVWFLRGLNALFTPELWGGGIEKAEAYLWKALALYATDAPQPPAPAWGYAETYTWLGRVYEKQGKPEAARKAYRQAIKLQPDSEWIQSRVPAVFSDTNATY